MRLTEDYLQNRIQKMYIHTMKSTLGAAPFPQFRCPR